MFVKRIHVFRGGNQTSAQGVQRKFSEKDLQQVVDTYDPTIHEAPLVIGHAGDNDSTPAYGWIQGFERNGDNLYADVAFTDTAKDLVKNGHYRKVSISFYSPDSAINPSKGKWSARHLALLGASPPAVKGLEPFSFSEEEGVFDFSLTLSPSEIFDEELGPTLLEEKSPLEMLKEKLDEVREEVSGAVKELEGNQQSQTNQNLEDAQASSVSTDAEVGQMANPDASQFKETTKSTGRERTEIAQQTADLETQFPEEEFMEKGKISRKHAKGAHGQVMQVVENVYEEAHKESEDERKEAADRSAEAKRQEGEGKMEAAAETKKKMKAEDKEFADHAENEEGRYGTARSDSDSYAKRMKVGKGPSPDRDTIAKSSEQDEDRMSTAKSSELEEDRDNVAKASGDEVNGNSRWQGGEDGHAQVNNADQYDDGISDIPEQNRPKESTGSDPYGRKESETKIPTETEEMPDDTVFAVDTTNVMDDKSMRVVRQKSSQGRKTPVGGAVTHSFNEEAEEELAAEHGEKKKKPEPAETVGEDGAYAETRGEKKSTEKQLTPGAMDEVDVAAEVVGPSGAHSEVGEKSSYTKTGKGSTYKGKVEEEEEDEYNEMSVEHCGPAMGYEELATQLAELKQRYSMMERKHQEEKMAHRRSALSNSIGMLYSEGRLTDGVMPEQELLSYVEGLEFGTLEFSEGETAATTLLKLLSNLPPMVSFGEVAGGSFQFAEEADLDPHQKALQLVERGEALDYVEALKKTMFS